MSLVNSVIHYGDLFFGRWHASLLPPVHIIVLNCTHSKSIHEQIDEVVCSRHGQKKKRTKKNEKTSLTSTQEFCLWIAQGK